MIMSIVYSMLQILVQEHQMKKDHIYYMMVHSLLMHQ